MSVCELELRGSVLVEPLEQSGSAGWVARESVRALNASRAAVSLSSSQCVQMGSNQNK